MGKSLGGDALGRVVEVTGRRGTPQPATWRIVVTEAARGTREIKVAGTQIVSEKSSSQVSSLKPIRLPDLNLDSSGAFDAANEQARKSRVPFTALDYSLRVNDASGKPVWNLELLNDTGAHVGGVRLAAHDGKLLSVNGFDQTPAAPVRTLVSADPDHDSVQPTRVGSGAQLDDHHDHDLHHGAPGSAAPERRAGRTTRSVRLVFAARAGFSPVRDGLWITRRMRSATRPAGPLTRWTVACGVRGRRCNAFSPGTVTRTNRARGKRDFPLAADGRSFHICVR